MIIRLIVVLLFGLISSSSLFAQEWDGAYFLKHCGAAVKQSDGEQVSPVEGLGTIICASYVGGFLDALSLQVTFGNGNKLICMPEVGIENDQAARVFVKYLRENPELLHKSGRMSLFIALQNAFPCPN